MVETVREGVQVSGLHAESIGRVIHDLEAKLSEYDSEFQHWRPRYHSSETLITT